MNPLSSSKGMFYMENKLDAARKIINEVDSQMAELFEKRMRAAEMVLEYKMENGLPILDPKREDAVIARNAALIEDNAIQGYYIDFLKNLMALSKAYQYQMQNERKAAYSLASADAAQIPMENRDTDEMADTFASLSRI